MQFRDELELLEIKLATLDAVTDEWVLSEARLTHAGQPKPLHFPPNKKRFSPWLGKLTYLVDSDPPEDAWAREQRQRRILSDALGRADDDDLVMVSDLDEVPDPQHWDALVEIARAGGVATPRLTMHVLGLRWRWPETWPGGARLVTARTLRGSYGGDVNVLFGTYNQDVGALWAGDGSRLYGPERPPGAGWHFSHLGGVEGVQTKLGAAGHLQFNTHPYNDREYIERCIESGDDLLGRPERRQEPAPIEQLPPYVLSNWGRFKHLW